MTQQSCPHSQEPTSSASSTGNSATTSTTDVYPLPFSLGQKEIVQNSDERRLVTDLVDNNVVAPGGNICITDSSDVTVGNRTFFNSDVTIYQYITGNRLSELQNGAAGQDEVQCNKNVRVVSPPIPPAPTAKPQSPARVYTRLVKASLILLTIATVICIATLVSLKLAGIEQASFVPTTTEEEPNTTVSPPSKIHYKFNKTQWGGRELPDPEPIDRPVHLVIIKHTQTESCWDPPDCFQEMQQMQSTDVGINHFRDIRYNFVIGGDGNIYEGRGWDVRNQQMNNSIDIAYIGDFNKDIPSEWVVGAGKWLIVKGMYSGFLDVSNLRVVCHNQTENTDSPGVNLFREVVKWDFYSSDIINGSSWKSDR